MVSHRRQRGVALITVLLVFALVAVIAAEMLRRGQLSLRSVGGLIETRQAYHYALAGEAFARQVLARDLIESTRQSDTLDEAWAQTAEATPFEIDGGSMKVEIRDLQARFNLNNVIDGSEVQGAEQFRRLLTVLQLNAHYADEWIDWVDRDQVITPGGAEDADYEGYLTAGRWEADVSALRLLRSMKPEDYARLAPHVTVLPAAGAKINVNTAGSAVLQSLSPIITAALASRVAVQQQSGGFATSEDFAKRAGVDGIDVATQSEYFEVLSTVTYAGRWQRVRTVLKRRKNQQGSVEFEVLSRVRSPLLDDDDNES